MSVIKIYIFDLLTCIKMYLTNVHNSSHEHNHNTRNGFLIDIPYFTLNTYFDLGLQLFNNVPPKRTCQLKCLRLTYNGLLKWLYKWLIENSMYNITEFNVRNLKITDILVATTLNEL